MIADGVPIPFQLVESDEALLCADMLVDSGTEYATDIRFTAAQNMHMIYIVLDYLPESVPARGMGTYGGISVYPVVNTVWNGTARQAASEGYVSVSASQSHYVVDIVNHSIDALDGQVRESHWYEDVSLQNSESLYVRFNSTDTDCVPYDLLVLRDGLLLDALFDGNCSVLVDCQNSTKAFQYTIPQARTPETGCIPFR